MPNIKEIKITDYDGNVSIVKIKFVDKPERLTDKYYPVKTGTLETLFYENEVNEKKDRISRYNLLHYLFYGRTDKAMKMISIEIPEGIECINEDSFNQYMGNLKLLILPDGIKEIDSHAFGLIYPKYIVTPENPVVNDFFKPGGKFQKKYGKYLKKSGYQPPKIFNTRDEFNKFLSDKKYKIEITGENNEVKEFEFNFNTPFAEINKNLSDQVIKFASDNNIKIKKIKIPDGIESINPEAFHNITDLEEVCFPSNIDYVWMEAFSGCKNLRHAEIKNINVNGYFSLLSTVNDLESVKISPQAAEKLFCGNLNFSIKLKLKFIFIDGEDGLTNEDRKYRYNLISEDAIFFDNLDDFEKARKGYRAQYKKQDQDNSLDTDKNKTPEKIDVPADNKKDINKKSESVNNENNDDDETNKLEDIKNPELNKTLEKINEPLDNKQDINKKSGSKNNENNNGGETNKPEDIKNPELNKTPEKIDVAADNEKDINKKSESVNNENQADHQDNENNSNKAFGAGKTPENNFVDININRNFDSELKKLKTKETLFKHLTCGSAVIGVLGTGFIFVFNPFIGLSFLILGIGPGLAFFYLSKKTNKKQKLVNVCALIKKEKNGSKIVKSDKEINLFLDRTNNGSLKSKISDIKKMFDDTNNNKSPRFEFHEKKKNLF